jgi:hypothetical protein
MTQQQVILATNSKLRDPAFRPYLEVRLSLVRHGSVAAHDLESHRFIVWNGRNYTFGPASEAGSQPCSGSEPGCERLPFGSNSPIIGDIAQIHSPQTEAPELWAYWFTYRVRLSDILSKLADRDGFVETLSSTTNQCPAPWKASTLLLAEVSLPTIDNPFTIQTKNDLMLRDDSKAKKLPTNLDCDLARYRAERLESIERR